MLLTAVCFTVGILAAIFMGITLGIIGHRAMPQQVADFETDDLQLFADIFALVLLASILGFVGATLWG